MITTEKTAFVYGGKTVNNTKIPVTVVYSDDKGENWTTCELDKMCIRDSIKTVQMSIAGTFIGAVFGLFTAFLYAGNLIKKLYVRIVVRVIVQLSLIHISIHNAYG